MSQSVHEILDLELAWKRVKRESAYRNFVRVPFEEELIEVNLPQWLEKCKTKLADNSFYPGPITICDVPKPGYHIRPGCFLFPIDRLVYTSLAGFCFSSVFEAIKWPKEQINFAYIMNPDPKATDWFRSPFGGWKAFRERSIKKIESGYSHVLFADIAGCYDNIDIFTLISNLKSISIPEPITDLLSKCLNRWAQISGRGIPQGYHASDVFAKLYLNAIDLHLSNAGFVHFRYVDDFRIFCHSETEAKKALMLLSKFLRRRGLNVQSAKSKIHGSEEAILEINGVDPIIKEVAKEFYEGLLKYGSPYERSPAADDKILNATAEDAPIEVLERAFDAYFIQSNDFDKTLFHYLLKRLAACGSEFAVDKCKELFCSHPEEAEEILKYFEKLDYFDRIQEFLSSVLIADDCIYPYQTYIVFEWIWNIKKCPSPEVLAHARDYSFNQSYPFYLRAVCRALIGEYGNHSDLELLEHLYSDTRDQFEKSEILCCMSRMEKVRRNAFYARAMQDGEFQQRAVEFIKNGLG